MAQARCVTIIGDSNSKRHMSENNIRGRPLMSGAQVVQCGRMPLFSEALKSLRVESDVCIISCMTNFLTNADGPPPGLSQDQASASVCSFRDS